MPDAAWIKKKQEKGEWVDPGTLPPPLDHEHFWRVIPSSTSRPAGAPRLRKWHMQHALARCIRKDCSAWTVTGYKEGPGPCKHSIGYDPDREPLLLELNACPVCGTPLDEDGGCERCDSVDAV